jgi:putative hydrolase of the HAD superfamily
VIRAVTFDFWGTLYGVVPPIEERRRRLRAEYAAGFFMGIGANVSGRQLEYALEIVGHDIEHFRMVRHTSFDAEEVGQRLGRSVGLQLQRTEAARLGELLSSAGREEPPDLVASARDVLRTLYGRVKLGLICDTGFTLGHDLYAVMEADDVGRLFHHFTFSNQTGTTKPEVRQFHHTLHGLGCLPAEAVHVGDLEMTDITGAKQAGMRAIRIMNAEADPGTDADAAVARLAEALDVLRGWGLTV